MLERKHPDQQPGPRLPATVLGTLLVPFVLLYLALILVVLASGRLWAIALLAPPLVPLAVGLARPSFNSLTLALAVSLVATIFALIWGVLIALSTLPFGF